ncbi:MAG: PRC-barrel domain-containing protein [Candidatus Kerfeldbacteria bacterium]|nr:PRC-barrel domain-containing protein [Candidatus Kerfeldbacteria bacterium]
MRAKAKQLLGLPVETASGAPLGRVRDCIFDTESHTIIQYEVRGTNPFAKERLIGAHQVVSISREKMVVEDLILKDTQQAPARPGVVPTA